MVGTVDEVTVAQGENLAAEVVAVVVALVSGAIEVSELEVSELEVFGVAVERVGGIKFEIE